MLRKTIKYVHSDYLVQQADKNPAVRKRASLVHNLIDSYDLIRHMELVQPKSCNPADLRCFHSADYVQQLLLYSKQKVEITDNVTSDSDDDYHDEDDDDVEVNVEQEKYGFGYDCRIWSTVHQYACCIAGATLTACESLCKSSAPSEEVIINWTGGWHHAHRAKAAGYCYVNDIVLGILVLLNRFQRVLYLDLDVHHGDGVQGAFEMTQRVFTLSFHRYEHGFYPGTGSVEDCGSGGAKGYTVNFPYNDGIRGDNFCKYFKRVTQKVLQRYEPEVCIIQCGADCIVNDPLGGTNLTPADLIDCIAFVMDQSLPTILLGGGGYNFANTSRFWTSLTAALCDQYLEDDIPAETPKFLCYGPDYCLKIEAMQKQDLNTFEHLENCAKIIEANLEDHNVRPNQTTCKLKA